MQTESPLDFLSRNNIKWKRQGDQAVMDCHECGKQGKLYMSLNTFLWDCKVCNAKGNERQFKVGLGLQYDFASAFGNSPESKAEIDLSKASKPKSPPSDVLRWSTALLHSAEARQARDYLASRAIPLEIAERYLLGWSPTPDGKPSPAPKRRSCDTSKPTTPSVPGWLVLPSFSAWTPLRRPQADSAATIKLRSVPPQEKAYRRLAGGESILYAPAGINPKQTLLIVGGEIDALSCIVAGHSNTISTTTGEQGWQDAWSLQLEEVEDIVIIYDNDEAGRNGAASLAGKLGEWRCRVGAWPQPYNDANEALVALGDTFRVSDIIATAQPAGGNEIVRIASLRDVYIDRLMNGNPRGLSTGWEDLDGAIGGVRDGEVTLLTGDTGSGKSTFASHWALNMAAQGVVSLVCPFELGPQRQLDKWVRQWSKTAPDKLPELALNATLDGLEHLPIWILNRYGQITLEAMRNTLMFAIKRLGVKWILLDHLHFMVDAGKTETADLSNMMKMFAKVAQQTAAHIVVLAHPRQHAQSDEKHKDNRIIQMSDLKGSAALKQDADTILSLWRPRKADRSDSIDASGSGLASVFPLKVRSDYGSETPVAFKYMIEGARYEVAEEAPTPTAVVSVPKLPPRRRLAGGAPSTTNTNSKHWTEVNDDDDSAW